MWKNSKPGEYISFRTFIFGITSQSMFPNGVVYEGINDNKPMFFRGESGANDSMVRDKVPSPGIVLLSSCVQAFPPPELVLY